MRETLPSSLCEPSVVPQDLLCGSDIHVMLTLRFCFQRVVIANEILDRADVIGQLLGKRQRTPDQT